MTTKMREKAKNRRGLMIGAAMGDCVHVAGALNFLRLASAEGYPTEFLGAAKSPEEIAKVARERKAECVAVGYRLDPNAAKNLIARLIAALEHEAISPKLLFGGIPPVAEVASASGLFDVVFSGKEDVDEVIAYLKGGRSAGQVATYADNLVDRIAEKAPYPVLRHHFGLPSVHATVDGIKEIAEAEVLDIISLGPDQNFQANYFRPEDMDRDQDGAGGVPVRSEADLRELYDASRRGNYPLMRCYSGTRDVISMAGLLNKTIHNAWGAIPLFWYNVLDGRGSRGVKESITEAQIAMEWHAQQGIPVEVNESHHWSLRDAPDVVAVAAAYLAAYNAKKAGVRQYVSQYMLNTPPGTSVEMDLGKMLAKDELINSLADENFTVLRQVRAGLSSFPTDLSLAKGQLATSTLVGMNLRPHIVHVVGFCEGDHIANPKDVIESCRIARGVIRNCLHGMPDMTKDLRVQARKRELIRDAKTLLAGLSEVARLMDDADGRVPDAVMVDGTVGGRKASGEEDALSLVRRLASAAGAVDSRATSDREAGNRGASGGAADDSAANEDLCPIDPYTDPGVLAAAVKCGLFDAPHLAGNPAACGEIETAIVDGGCLAVDPVSKKPISEAVRVEAALDRLRRARSRKTA
jgi:methylmalonyl-CoA mutase cobalamin-binding subunit